MRIKNKMHLGFKKIMISKSSSFMIIWRSNMRITNVASDLTAVGKIKMRDTHIKVILELNFYASVLFG